MNPGSHVLNRNWHPNQKIKQLSNGTIELSFDSEINIELVGWIAMWLDNVKVVSPNELKILLKEKLDRVYDIMNADLLPTNNG